MLMLTEYKDDTYHYYQDDQGRLQGECKYWHSNGQLRSHCYYKDGELHGEFKRWYSNGHLRKHCYYKDSERHGECKWWDENAAAISHYFYQDGNDITIEVEALVVDIKNITNKERMLIKLKFGIECLC